MSHGMERWGIYAVSTRLLKLWICTLISAAIPNFTSSSSHRIVVNQSNSGDLHDYNKSARWRDCHKLKDACENFIEYIQIGANEKCASVASHCAATVNRISGTAWREWNVGTEFPRKIAALIDESNSYLSDDVKWDFMGREDDICVWKLRRSSMNLKKEDGDWPCVKSSTVIETDSRSLLEYLLDSTKAEEYNKYSAGRSDIEILSPNSKVIWTKMNIPTGIKPYDFCSLMHFYSKPASDEILLVSKHTEHPLVPVNKDFGRSEKIMGLNILKPLRSSGNRSRTEITCISHQRYASTPPFMIERSMMRGKINYLRKLREVTQKRS